LCKDFIALSALPGRDNPDAADETTAEGERAVKRLIIAIALLATVAAPALAQRKPYSVMSDEEKADDKAKQAVDRQYRTTMERTRKDTPETQVDPWANMRGAAPDTAKKKN
jgi:Ni/Co efflux regulator RcnB